MATVLQWQSHITDSTDRETILGNLDLLEQFAKSINGGDKFTLDKQELTLSSQFESLRAKIKDGSIKPTEWKTSQQLVNITKALTNASSDKLDTLTRQGEDVKKRLGTAEGNITSQAGKLNQQAQTLSSQGTRLATAESSIESHGTRLGTAERDIKSHGTTLSGNGTRITNAETAHTSQGSSIKTITDWKDDIEKIGKLASSAELESLKTLLNKEVSHWTADTAPIPTNDYVPADQIKASDQPWGKNEDPERHVGDLCTVIGEGQKDKGVSYRFVINPSGDSYKWLKVIDNDGALALSQQAEFETAYNRRQTAIDSALAGKQPKGNYVEKTDYDKDNTKVVQEINNIKSTYQVKVTTKGEIRNGEIVDGTTQSGTPAILHTAHVYGILGNKVTSMDSKLTWTINKNRTTDPKQRTVTGATCYITAKDFVRTVVESGTAPCYYDIELNSSF